MAGLRVLQVATSYPQGPDDVSGPFIYRLVNALDATNEVSCTVLTPSGTRATVWPGKSKVIRFRYAPRPLQILAHRPGGIPKALEDNPSGYLLLAPFLFFMWFHVARLARGFDVIHAHWSVPGYVASCIPFRRPIVVTLHGSDVNKAASSRLYAAVLKRVLRKADAVVPVSEQMAKDLKESCQGCAKKVHFIPNGVAQAFFHVEPAERNEREAARFLYVGSLVENKGVSVLIKALAKIKKRRGFGLQIAGEGPERNNLEAMVQKHNLSNLVTFLGAVSPDRVVELMAGSHCLVLPSFHEGRPSVVLEAMAAGLPVVATDIPGTRELVLHGKTGLLVAPGHVDGLRDALETIISKPRLAKAMGMAGRGRMLELGLTWETTARRYIELYRQILESPLDERFMAS